MIGKILHGSGFAGLIDYVIDPRKNAELVANTDGINTSNNQTIADSFIMQAGLSSRTKKPVGHFVLSFSPHDAPYLTDESLYNITNEYLKRMGYVNNMFLAYQHHDKEHPHVHIIVNRVDGYGRCTSDSHEKERNVRVCRELTKEYGLYIAHGKDAVKENRLRAMDSIRFQMLHYVRESLEASSNWKEFQEDLSKVGMRCQFRFNPKTSAIEGVSFTINKHKVKDKSGRVNSKMRHDVSFSGKQLDPSLTLSNLCAKLGNPVSIAHQQAKAMYEDAREDWFNSHTPRECDKIDSIFPDFDLRFPMQAREQMNEAPDINGTSECIDSSAFSEIMEKATDVANAANGCIYAGINTMLELAFVPYQPALSTGGGGGNAKKKGWGDDDKYKPRYSVYRSRRKGGGRSR